jgi:hypothetical protein
MPINLEIPRTMTVLGLQYLERLACAVSADGLIVEVGALYGSSTWTLAKSCLPSVRVFSIDPWESTEWISNRFPADQFPSFSIESFQEYLKDCKNVTPIPGYSPEIVSQTWKEEIDLYFDDGVHENPSFINNLNFWRKFVKPGGILCGDDYASGSPDIVREVDQLAYLWGVQPEVMGRVWALRVPLAGSTQSLGVASQLPPLPGPNVQVTAICHGHPPYKAPPLVWAGQLHKSSPLEAFKLEWNNPIDHLDVTYRCGTNEGGLGAWTNSGDYCRLDKSARSPLITQVEFALTGSQAHNYKILYQAGFSHISTKTPLFNDTANSRMYHQGQVLIAPNPNQPIGALRVVVENRLNSEKSQ